MSVAFTTAHPRNAAFFEDMGVADRHPGRDCHGTRSEMVWEDGGDAGFVSRIVTESVNFADRFIWFTSLIGRKRSINVVREVLSKISGVTHVVSTRLMQGRTMRWAIAWTCELHS